MTTALARELLLDGVAARALAAVPGAVLIKGATTREWLYPGEERVSRDVDLLVDPATLPAVLDRLGAAGFRRSGGRPGEEAAHAVLLRSAEGIELDLHLHLPLAPAPWAVLAPHVTTGRVAGRTVRLLDEPARCVLLALHAAANTGPGVANAKAREDLRRARALSAAWPAAAALADRLGAADAFRTGLLTVETGTVAGLGLGSRLLLADAPPVALAAARLAAAPLRARPRLLLAEVFPSRAFLAATDPGHGPAVAHLRRWGRLVAQVPAALGAVRRARAS